MHDPRDIRELVRDEREERRISGFDVSLVEAAAEAAVEDAGLDDATLEDILGRICAAPRLPGRAVEPAAAEALAALPAADVPRLPGADLDDRILGAWLGRCAGCVLGKPIEGWPADAVRTFLETYAAWPPVEYLPGMEPWPAGYPDPKPSWRVATRGRIQGTPRDDDIDYTILGLHILERYGRGFTTADVAVELLDKLPFTQVYTAERAAYRNLVVGVTPPATAVIRNPYREWIGALIRADIFGFASPGDPRAAAVLAWRDARLSHDGNGLYAAMWAAGSIAAALVHDDPAEAVAAGLRQVPPGTRLHEAVATTLVLRRDGARWEEALAWMRQRWAGYHWVHAVNNTAAIAAAVLWGDRDFSRTVGLAVAAGWDTDSDGATAGSIVGALIGAGAIPTSWTAPLEDRVHSSIAGFDGIRISELAARSARLARSAPTENVRP